MRTTIRPLEIDDEETDRQQKHDAVDKARSALEKPNDGP
jgi:hypothetical protein